MVGRRSPPNPLISRLTLPPETIPSCYLGTRYAQFQPLPGRHQKQRGIISMAKELRTADQLSDMIVSALAVNDVDIQIRREHAYGWQPTVASSPGDLIGYQRR